MDFGQPEAGGVLIGKFTTVLEAATALDSKPMEVPLAGRLGQQVLLLQSLLGPLHVRRGDMRIEARLVAPFHIEQNSVGSSAPCDQW